MRLYRDETNLAAHPDLWGTIVDALNKSRYFILIASPEAASSKWVCREVEHWLSSRHARNFIIVMSDGDLVWDDIVQRIDRLQTTALPTSAVDRLIAEPLFVDLRWVQDPDVQLTMSNPQFVNAVATIAAELHGKSKDEIAGDDVREHRRTRLVSYTAMGIVLLLTVGMSVFAWNYVKEREQSIAQRARAEQSLLTAAARQTTLLTRDAKPEEGWQTLKDALTRIDGRRSVVLPSLFYEAALEALMENRYGPELAFTLSESSAKLAQQEDDFEAGHPGVLTVFDATGRSVATAKDPSRNNLNNIM